MTTSFELLADPMGKDEYRARLNRTLASIQEESGGWNDRDTYAYLP